MKISRLLLASSLAAIPLIQAQATLIAPARLAPWTSGITVGVPGGIPTDRTNIVDVTQAPYNADPTGATDCHDAILAAINAANSGDIIYLPAGTYLVNETISPKSGARAITPFGARETPPSSKWMRRGGGGGEGLFYLSAAATATLNGITRLGSVAITGGLTQGSTVLTVASTSAVIDGGMIQIAENNNTTLPVIHVSRLSRP